MAIDRDLIGAIAREFHGRTDLDEAMLTETAHRLSAFLAKVRLADERELQAVSPAFSFDPGAPTYRTAPQKGDRTWRAMVRAGGGSGYGGAAGTTGVAASPRVEQPAGRSGGPEFLWWPVTDLAAAIGRRELSPLEVTRAVLDRIDALDKSLNAFVTVMADAALRDAKAAEAARGPRGPLHGVPVALKDIIETAGVRTTGGSRVLAGYVPTHDATVVTRLRTAGAVIVGKTATHEFAFGATTDSPYHGPVHNPWNLQKIAAGSSGGSGAAVAAGLVPAALGTDTGGSIRMPAAHCGIIGLKPTYGRVTKAGIFPLSWSLDHVGPLTRTVRDAALLLGVLAGPDPLDPTALPMPVDDYAQAAVPGDLKGVRVGVPRGWLDGRVDPGVLACFEAGLEQLRDLGAGLVEVELPAADVMTFVNRLITFGEVGAYHAVFLKDRAGDYSPDVRPRMEMGACVSARDYLVGQRLRGEMARQVHAVMAGVDVLATPTVAIPPATIGQPKWEYPDGRREPVVEAMVRFPAPFSVTGQPAISVPCGLTDDGLPVGMQLVGQVFGEAALVRIAAAYEAAAAPVQRPPL